MKRLEKEHLIAFCSHLARRVFAKVDPKTTEYISDSVDYYVWKSVAAIWPKEWKR